MDLLVSTSAAQALGFTFTVEESPPFASWGTAYLHDVLVEARHFVIATEDDVVEVICRCTHLGDCCPG